MLVPNVEIFREIVIKSHSSDWISKVQGEWCKDTWWKLRLSSSLMSHFIWAPFACGSARRIQPQNFSSQSQSVGDPVQDYGCKDYLQYLNGMYFHMHFQYKPSPDNQAQIPNTFCGISTSLLNRHLKVNICKMLPPKLILSQYFPSQKIGTTQLFSTKTKESSLCLLYRTILATPYLLSATITASANTIFCLNHCIIQMIGLPTFSFVVLTLQYTL